jgi:putative flippase GtrA
MISQKGGVFMFLRAQLSAQMATIADFLVTILLVRLFDVYYVYATLAGAIYGGIINCIINYKWTFKSKGKKTHVAVKFIIVWVCSIWLNTWGTYTLTESLKFRGYVIHSANISVTSSSSLKWWWQSL